MARAASPTAGGFDGRSVIVSGAARGQGAAEVRLLVERDAQVVIADRLVDEGEALAAELGAAVRFVELDVTDAAQWRGAVAAAGELGPLGGLVNNAGIHWTKPLEVEDADGLRRMLEVNLVGAFHGMQAVVPELRAAGGGAIVNIASTGGLAGLPYHSAYGASKWALRGLSRTAAVELGPHGIRVNVVCPGAVDTAMLPQPKAGRSVHDRFTHLPLGRAAEPDEVAQLVVYLLSDQSSYQTGGEYVIDGGSMAGPAATYEWRPPSDSDR